VTAPDPLFVELAEAAAVVELSKWRVSTATGGGGVVNHALPLISRRSAVNQVR
jgi:hypothetical protein